MVDDKYNPSNSSEFDFVERYFQKLIWALRQPDTGYAPWLADVLAFLVENIDRIESFGQTKSYFEPQLYSEILEWMRRPDSTQPPWIVDSLDFLVKHIEQFPPEGDEDTYIVEYIYPH